MSLSRRVGACVVRHQCRVGAEHGLAEDFAAPQAPRIADMHGGPIAALDGGREIADRLLLAIELEAHHRVVAVGMDHHGVVALFSAPAASHACQVGQVSTWSTRSGNCAS